MRCFAAPAVSIPRQTHGITVRVAQVGRHEGAWLVTEARIDLGQRAREAVDASHDFVIRAAAEFESGAARELGVPRAAAR